jgi:hypothetical protein
MSCNTFGLLRASISVRKAKSLRRLTDILTRPLRMLHIIMFHTARIGGERGESMAVKKGKIHLLHGGGNRFGP